MLWNTHIWDAARYSRVRSSVLRNGERRYVEERRLDKDEMMKSIRRFIFAALLAGSASLVGAQGSPYGSTLSSGAGLGAPLAQSPYGTAMPSGTAFRYPTGISMSSSTELGHVAPSPENFGGVGRIGDPLSPTAHYPLVNCHPGGCSGSDGTQYVHGAGNVMFGSNGKICQYTAPGAPLVCN